MRSNQNNIHGTISSIINSFITRTLVDNNNDDLIKGRTRNCCLEVKKDL
jgi:hypothetical protein